MFFLVYGRGRLGAIIYLVALAGVDPGLHEAAIIDGATKLREYATSTSLDPADNHHCTHPAAGFDHDGRFREDLLMQNSLNLDSSEVISTYVYKTGPLGTQYSFSAAVGLFDSIVNFILLVTVNRIAKNRPKRVFGRKEELRHAFQIKGG